jgi:hypothetical protein
MSEARAQLRASFPERLAPIVAVAVALVAQSLMPNPQLALPRWVSPTVEGVLVVGLLVGEIAGASRRVVHTLRYLLGASLVVAASGSAFVLIRDVVHAKPVTVQTLLAEGLAILVVASVGFALIFWQLDRGGPDARVGQDIERFSFWFPQDGIREISDEFDNWQPTFFDYYYVSATNLFAFSPTDTMPLTRFAKFLMLWESVLSLGTLALVLARAINIL